MRRVKRSKKIQNQLRKMSLYYLNIRELKSKWISLKSIIEEEKPAIVGLTETWLDKDEEIKLDGYSKIFRNEHDDEGGGGGDSGLELEDFWSSWASSG